MEADPVSMRDDGLSVLAYADGFTLWYYRAIGDEDARKRDFFEPAAHILGGGDMMIVASSGRAPAGLYEISIPRPGRITLKPLTTV